MTDADAFRRAIAAAPDDDTPRLVFADYLDEHGEPDRAEFVRVQCELAGSSGITEVRCDALRRRERELLKAHAKDWLGDLGDWPPFYGEMKGYGWQGNNVAIFAEFRRGFVAAVSAPLAVLFGGGPCGCWPYDGRRVVNNPGYGPPLIDCPACHGTGTRPGHAAALFAAQPVERVTLTDRGPGETLMDWYGCRWVWDSYHRGLRDYGQMLPEDLFDLVCEYAVYADHECAGFKDRAAALDALSRAAVTYGRRVAGLPPPPAAG
jgi:uncharacterized protein (TIGR02996 family)